MCFLCLLAASGGDFEKAVLAVSGAAEVEDLAEDEMERYRTLAAHPLDLNAAGPGRLKVCGLFSPFQIAALIEYRQQTGDIMSWTELALVNGFNEELVTALKEFVKLESRRPPGQAERNAVSQEMILRGAVRQAENSAPEFNYGVKYGLQWGERAEFNWATRTTYEDGNFKPGTISAAWYGRGWLSKVVAGDFSARFGQGLTAWTGFSLSGYTTTQAFRRNASGLSPSTSFTSKSKGLGIELRFGRWCISGAWSFSERLPVANVARVGETATFGLTASSGAASFDWTVSFAGLSLYGEAGWNGAPMALAGTIWIPEYGSKYAALAKYKDHKLTCAICADTRYLTASVQSDLDYNKMRETYKLVISTSPSFEKGEWTLNPAIRISARLKPQEPSPWRTDLRADIEATSDVWLSHLRFNCLWCKDYSWMGYLEGGFRNGKYAVYARGTVFFIDNWDDRIYVYERDAPGSFNVPALYGRGFSASLTAALKFSRQHTIHARAGITSYPWMPEPKPSRFEVKLQYTLKIPNLATRRGSPSPSVSRETP